MRATPAMCSVSIRLSTAEAPMIAPFRYARSLGEALVCGPGYAAIQHLIRHPEPLHPEQLWGLINPEGPAQANRLNEIYPPTFVRHLLLRAKMKQDHKKGIAHHYDVSNEFYRLFLDKKYMFYTCADFHSDQDTLEQAQTNKANFLVNLIDPQPGEKILDMGCGWGAMLKRILEETNDKPNLHGYTLSEEQVRYNDEHNGFKVELKNFITCDYEKEAFDKIYFIGSYEHVRHDDVEILMKKLHHTLRPKGRVVIHFFCPLTERLHNDTVTAQIFFPGTRQPAFNTQMQAFEKAGFRLTHRSLHDYRPTLKAWFDNLAANQDAAIDLVGLRLYNQYLVFFAASYSYFDRGSAVLVRCVLEK